jgi:VWFA-related protein
MLAWVAMKLHPIRVCKAMPPNAPVTRDVRGRITPAILAALVLICQSPQLVAQQSKPTDQDDVVRVKTDLVQLRAVVTDRKGQLVDNLKQDDFEVLENSRPQRVGFFSLERIQNRSASPITAGGKSGGEPDQPKSVSPAAKPPRTMVLFVDTLHLSNVSLVRAKQQLKRFVDEQITDEDLVGIVTTSDSLGVLGQFMRDRKTLKYAIDKITGFIRPTTLFTPYLAAKVLSENPSMPLRPPIPGPQSSMRNPSPDLNQSLSGQQATAVAKEIMTGEDGIAATEAMAQARAREVLGEEHILRRTTLQALKAVSERMAEMPGQRLIAFISDGFTMLDAGGGADNQEFAVATSRAVRSGAIIYSFSPQGLTTPVEFTAASPVHFSSEQPTLGAAFGSYMADSRMDQQGTLRNLAADTGGEAYLNSNDIAGQFKKMLDSNGLYYALAYYPQDETNDKFRNIKVRVKNHPEYHVRTQRGYQPSKESKQEIATTPQQKLFQAMIAPLPVTTLGVTSSASFLERADDDAKVTLQIHFNGDLLEYPEQDQKYLLNCEVAVAVLDRSGKISNSGTESITAAFTHDQLKKAKQNGYRYSQRLNVAPGLYQIRIGVRDGNGGLMGTSSSWVNVPDLSHKKLALSDVFLGKERSDEQSQIAATGGKQNSAPSLVIGPASFKTGEMILYRLVLYDAPNDTQAISGFRLKVEVLQSGTSVYEGPWQPLASRIIRSDRIGTEIGGQLRMEMAPGIYTLSVTIKDVKSNKTTHVTIDLELAS